MEYSFSNRRSSWGKDSFRELKISLLSRTLINLDNLVPPVSTSIYPVSKREIYSIPFSSGVDLIKSI